MGVVALKEVAYPSVVIASFLSFAEFAYILLNSELHTNILLLLFLP